MEKTLELIFTKSDGAKKTLSIADPREGVTLAEAQSAAAKIIEAGVLISPDRFCGSAHQNRYCYRAGISHGYQRAFQRCL